MRPPPVCCTQEQRDKERSEEDEAILVHEFIASIVVLFVSGVLVTEDLMVRKQRMRVRHEAMK